MSDERIPLDAPLGARQPGPARPARTTPRRVRSTVPDIPYPVRIGDGTTAQVYLRRMYQVRWHGPSDAGHDREAEAVLRKIERTERHGPRLVFNGSPVFGDQAVYPEYILVITEVPAGVPPDLRVVPRQPKPPVTGERPAELEIRDLTEFLATKTSLATRDPSIADSLARRLYEGGWRRNA